MYNDVFDAGNETLGCSSARALHFYLSRTGPKPTFLEHSAPEYLSTPPQKLLPSPTSHGYERRLAIHMAMAHHTRIDSYYCTTTEPCRRFIRFARSRSRNKEYLTALKTVEKLLAVTEVALNNFRMSLESTPESTPTDYFSVGRWEVESNGSSSEPGTPSLEIESATWGTTNTGSGWDWVANLIVYYHKTLHSGKLEIITDSKRNSWSRFLEQRYSDWLANDVVWLSKDHRDGYDEEQWNFDFGQYVEELLMPGRQYGLLLDMIGDSVGLDVSTRVIPVIDRV
ncbi:hypothetical protein VNI00_014148 [Paramarasmius palmivorus]|uniref:Uncharacterized protein n=1 Tax=Paramarasmius palmivorus TaxID=297713 RepID=A0AAW0BYP9_9AGAR